MDLTDLQDMVRAYVRGKVTRTGPGQTYGPAQSIYTHTPIEYAPDRKVWESGHLEAVPENIVSRMIPKPIAEQSRIVINPLSRDNTDMSSTLRHEDTHALLNGLTADSYQYLAGHNPAYPAVAKALKDVNRSGFIPQEAPAYMAETDPTDPYHVSPSLRNLYVTNMANQLDKINPPTAAVYKRLARIQ